MRIRLAVLSIVAVGIMPSPVQSDEKAVRKELAAAYAGIARATNRKDVKTWLSYLTAGYSEKGTNGSVSKRPQIDKLRKQSLAAVQSILARYDITRVSSQGNTATALVRYSVITVTRAALDPEGKTHRVIVTAPTRHVWVKTANGWKMKSGETLKGSAMTVDGRPVQVR